MLVKLKINMQNKLYYLNEEEKNRILNLHKSRFNINEQNVDYGTPNIAIPSSSSGIKINRSSIETIENDPILSSNQKFVEIVEFKCKNNKYGGTPNEKIVQKKLGYFKANFIGRTFWFTNDALKEISNEIKELGTMATFCKLSEEFEKSAGKSLPIRLWKSVYSDSAFASSFKSAIEYLEKNASTNVQSDPVTTTKKNKGEKESKGENLLLQPILKKHKEELAKQNQEYSRERKWRSLGSKYDSQILDVLGKSGTELTDNDIKDIYNKLKTAGKIKE